MELYPSISPDGRFFAYQSNDTGRFEVYVMKVESRRRWLISTAGGGRPTWTRDGGEIVFASRGERFSVAVSTEPEFTHSTPEALYPLAGYAGNYEVTADGARFLQLKREDAAEQAAPETPHIRVVLNWFEELKQRVPIER